MGNTSITHFIHLLSTPLGTKKHYGVITVALVWLLSLLRMMVNLFCH